MNPSYGIRTLIFRIYFRHNFPQQDIRRVVEALRGISPHAKGPDDGNEASKVSVRSLSRTLRDAVFAMDSMETPRQTMHPILKRAASLLERCVLASDEVPILTHLSRNFMQ